MYTLHPYMYEDWGGEPIADKPTTNDELMSGIITAITSTIL